MAKYIFIARNTVPFANPAGLVVYRIAKALSDLGHDVDIFSLNKPTGEQKIPEWLTDGDKIHIKSFDLTKKNNISVYLRFILTLFSKIKKELKENKFIYIVTHTNPLYTHWVGFLCKLFFYKRVKWISSFTDPYVRSPFSGYAKFTVGTGIRILEQKLSFYFSEKIIFVTDTMKNYICRENKSALNKSIVIPFFYLKDWEKRILNCNADRQSRDDQRLIIMHAGSIYGNRDASKFLNALEEHESTILFKNLGVVNQKIQYTSNNILITNPLPYGEMISYLKNTDYILIIDSFFDNIKNPYMPSKVVDAMYLHKPIIGITEKNSELDVFLRKTGNISIPNDRAIISSVLLKIKRKGTCDFSLYADSNLSDKFRELEC
ncbi:TPA: glycosyltransferase [Escherichia albertii]|uniref:Glycosyl transferase n=1 Tax=Escherichia albertii TaxID=208962 RepID=A0A288W4B9_ESCAL|nr:glycosyltransferase [Escherichia albertii]ARO72729.1 glycosyl transferase [Escherichia albertii]BBM62408.1 putative glycosyltransferase [Escherichia albertii]HCQ4573288.1 glycosyltransferase [Escherichia albertii]